MADQRQTDQVFVYVEIDQGDVEVRSDQVFVYIEIDQGDIEVRSDQVFAYIEYLIIVAEGRVYGPALGVMGG